MSKNIRVAWDDLQPGDKVHLKGSDNVYHYVRDALTAYDDMPCNGKRHNKIIVTVPGIYDAIKVPKSMFAYATRPAPRKPKIRMPHGLGEYWIRNTDGWLKLIVGPTVNTVNVYDVQIAQGCNSSVSTPNWGTVISSFQPFELITAEEYYTRKIKGEL